MVERYKPKQAVGDKLPSVQTHSKKGQLRNPRGRGRDTAADIVAKELHATVFITENGQRIKTSKFGLLVKQAMNQAIAGNCQSLVLIMRNLDPLERLNNVPAKGDANPYDDIDIAKLSLDDKIKTLDELIANSKPLDWYQK